MDDKSNKRPLRSTTNKIKDLYNSYLKNDEPRNLPIDDSNEQTEPSDDVVEKVESALKQELKRNESLEQENIELQEKIELTQAEAIDRIKELESQLEIMEFKLDDAEKEQEKLKDIILRKTAEMENFRRRSAIEKQELIEHGNAKLLAKFIEIPDDLFKAIDSAKKNADLEVLITGLDMILNKMGKLLVDAGVKRMEINPGDLFDVDYHEALMMTPSNEFDDGTVVQVFQDGYLMGEKVLRHAKVITSSGAAQ